MRKWLIVLLVLSITPAGAGPAWTWTDSSGLVHYSDTPVPGAKRIELGSVQGFGPAQGGSVRRPAQAQTQEPQGSTANEQSYSAVTIMSPTQQQTLWNTGGELSVQLATEPTLRPGDRVDLILDGQRRNLDSASTQLTLEDVFRGVHTVEAVVVDSRGRELARSAPVTFIVQQTSVANPK
ncbi:MAG TPA: DUF4124 domain-containing protein [Gammaproteobacteria bacterium]|nr:DUF4124 domain-containing protein [Gammaproteobacteria bacterium]